MKIISTALVASVIALVPAGAAVADPGLDDVHPHQHLLLTPNGVVSIGPDACDNANAQQGFNQFHYNVHRSASSPTNPVSTLGPQNGAPGLHDGQGAEMVRPADCD